MVKASFLSLLSHETFINIASLITVSLAKNWSNWGLIEWAIANKKAEP